ncbi:MAG: tRNA guanosine(34) transglycosylase Tgt [Spirochaetaceae bacterium]|nr:tRNA guanosine(34) transglycosylase Tgt [Spirochaetaceae bacterium]
MTGAFFAVAHTDSACPARAGIMDLPHGRVTTPVFMPVGTNATVKAQTVDDLERIGFRIILSNTYHLYLRPGTEVIGAAGGLHNFMRWDRNILTDSGGFQVFSLAPMRKIQDEGVRFRSHIDGSYHSLTPENVVEIQKVLGSDIQMQLDVCTPWGISYKEAEEALRLTTLWLKRAKSAWEKARDSVSDTNGADAYRGKLFAIVQGNFFRDLRARSAESAAGADTPGIAIGGLSVGEEEPVFLDYLSYTASLLPPEKPRYVMGIGTPQYILGAIERGIDMFDCVFPTRTARNGHVFSRRGPYNLKKAENRLKFEPIDKECGCGVCRKYSLAYLRHLFKTQEILCSMLATYHNLYFLHDLVEEARRAIMEDRFLPFKKSFLETYSEGNR